MNTLLHTQRGASAVAVVAAVAVAALAAFAGYWYGSRQGDAKDASAPAASTAPQSTAASGDLVDTKTGRKVLYWHDPMAPGQKFDKPGKSPFMDMELVPVYADEASDSGAVSINPRLAQSFGVRTAVAQPGDLASTFSAVGAIAVDERSMVGVQSRVQGFVEKLHVRATFEGVRAGQPIAEELSFRTGSPRRRNCFPCSGRRSRAWRCSSMPPARVFACLACRTPRSHAWNGKAGHPGA